MGEDDSNTNCHTVSISGAISIPFILLAFNQQKIANWVKYHKKRSITWVAGLTCVVILLSVIWTQKPLASGMKAAITVVIVLLVMVGAITQGIVVLVAGAKKGSSSSGSSSRESLVEY